VAGLDVNGVVFGNEASQKIAVNGTESSSLSGTYAAETAEYDDLLNAGKYGCTTISLTVRKKYRVQVWSHDDRAMAAGRTHTHSDRNMTGGHTATGVFAPDNRIQYDSVTGSGPNHQVANGVALDEISESAALHFVKTAAKELNPGEMAQGEPKDPNGQPGSLAGETPEEYDRRMQWFNEARFGMFIHWGPVTLTDRNIGWSRDAYRSGYHLQPKDNPGLDFTTPADLYDDLYKYWNPVKFNADEWMRTAAETGMKYVVLVVKHHDGFCLYDSKLTDYKSTGPEAKWKRDVLRDIAESCRKRGLRLVVYYSLGDWYHPDPFTENHDRYLEYMHGQLREILTGYGDIAGIWFDLGAAHASWDPVTRKMTNGPKKLVYDHNIWGAEEMMKMFHELQPGILVNNRARAFGDYDTPEQKLGTFNMDRRWESCITLGRVWVWKPRDEIKTASQVLALLQRSAGGDGNMLLNIGPKPDGTIEDRQVAVLKEVGQWMDQYGQSIYGTRAGPYKPNRELASTRKGDTVYLHLLTNKDDAVKLPPLPARVLEAHVMGSDVSVSVEQNAEHLKLVVPENFHETKNLVIELKLDRPAMEIDPIATEGSNTAPENLR
jgi:alpha-L-fucosidase